MESNTRDVFISYHMSSCTDFVKQISSILEERGISCWYAHRDCKEKFAGTIVSAIRNCKVFLLILNENVTVSEHCLNEVSIAFDRINRHEDITFLPFRIDNCALSDDLYYYINRIHIQDGTIPPEAERLRELIDRISLLLDRLPSVQSVVTNAYTQEAETYELVGEIANPDTSFVGRKKEIDAIHQKMSGRNNKLMLVGMGGIGKSEIAKMYIRTYQKDYDVVVWVDFRDSLCETIADDALIHIKGLSHSDYPNEDTRNYMLRKLGILKEMDQRRILIVMDNFDVLQDPDLDTFCRGKYGIIFTTRNHNISSRIPCIEILPMEDDTELMDLFRITYQRELDEEKQTDVAQIIQLLCSHTLSIRLVGQTMMDKRISPAKMLELLKTGLAGMKQSNTRAANQLSAGLRKLFDLSVFSDEECYLMKNLALIPNSGIEVELFFRLCELEDFDTIDILIAKNWIIHDATQDRVHLHPLIAELMLEDLISDFDCCSTYIKNLSERCERLVQCSYKEKLEHGTLSQSAVDRLPKAHPMYQMAQLNLAENNFNLSLYADAAVCYQSLLTNSTDLYYQIHAYYQLAHMATLSGNHQSCHDLAMEGFEIVKQLKNTPVSVTLRSRCLDLITRIAQSCRALGKYDTAVYYYNIAYQDELACAKAAPDDKDLCSKIGWSEYHLSNALFMKGDYAEAEQLARSCAERFKNSGDIWSYAHAINLVGHYEVRNGNLQKGLDMNQEAMDILLPKQGYKHLGRAKKLESRGDLYAAGGVEEKAFDYWNQACTLYAELGFNMKANELEQKIAALKENRYIFIIAP